MPYFSSSVSFWGKHQSAVTPANIIKTRYFFQLLHFQSKLKQVKIYKNRFRDLASKL